MNQEKTLRLSADKAGMHEQTARKYLKAEKLPDDLKKPHTWKTREDPFAEDWEEIKGFLNLNPGLEAKTVFTELQRRNPGKYQDGQLRTLQRKIKQWRALEGPPKEVMFPQIHKPGRLSQSDYTHMDKLGITIKREQYNHLIYHFVLTYSNWETGTICYSESFESLSEGLQNGLWKLGGVPELHQTDRLTAAVQKPNNSSEFTKSYAELLAHYKLEGRKIQANSPHENGDVEQRHNRFKRALDQQLMMRGSRDFESLEEYKQFLNKLFKQLNAGRYEKLQEELKVLKELPASRLDSTKEFRVKVSGYSTINIQHNTYSVDSRLIKEKVKVYLYANYLELWYAQKKLAEIPRLRGDGKHYIQYRHIIDWLIRKPGAFENYKYREDLYPTSYFRMAYDVLKRQHTEIKATKEYLKILYLAAKVSEDKVNQSLKDYLECGKPIEVSEIKKMVEHSQSANQHLRKETKVVSVDLSDYDKLLSEKAGRV